MTLTTGRWYRPVKYSKNIQQVIFTHGLFGFNSSEDEAQMWRSKHDNWNSKTVNSNSRKRLCGTGLWSRSSYQYIAFCGFRHAQYSGKKNMLAFWKIYIYGIKEMYMWWTAATFHLVRMLQGRHFVKCCGCSFQSCSTFRIQEVVWLWMAQRFFIVAVSLFTQE